MFQSLLNLNFTVQEARVAAETSPKRRKIDESAQGDIKNERYFFVLYLLRKKHFKLL